MGALSEKVFETCVRGRFNVLRMPDDAIWATFFAVARPPVWSLRNACVATGERRRYFFAIDADPRADEPWTEGAVYLLPPDTFEQTYDAEWISPTPVRPGARLAVTKDDFPFAHRVFRHRFGEREAAFLGRLARAGLAGKAASLRNI